MMMVYEPTGQQGADENDYTATYKYAPARNGSLHIVIVAYAANGLLIIYPQKKTFLK